MTEHSHRVGAPYRVTSPEATREEGDRLRRSLDGAILVHLRTRKVLDDPHLSAEEKVEKLGGIVGLAGGNAYRTADEEEARALKAVISARDRTIANQAKEIEDLHDQLVEKGVIDDEMGRGRFAEEAKDHLQRTTERNAELSKAAKELKRQLDESRETSRTLRQRRDQAESKLARVRYELRYDPKISAQSHLNRVRRVAGVSRWS